MQDRLVKDQASACDGAEWIPTGSETKPRRAMRAGDQASAWDGRDMIFLTL